MTLTCGLAHGQGLWQRPELMCMDKWGGFPRKLCVVHFLQHQPATSHRIAEKNSSSKNNSISNNNNSRYKNVAVVVMMKHGLVYEFNSNS